HSGCPSLYITQPLIYTTAMGKSSRKKERPGQAAFPSDAARTGHRIPVYLKSMRFPWWALIAIVLLTFIAYSSAFRGDFIVDDDYYVAENPLLTAPHGLWQIWTTTKSPQYYPLVFTTFWMEHRLWGLNTMGYHLVNVSLHAVNSIIVFWLF